MGFADIFLGAKPSYNLLPGVSDSINSINNLSFGGLGAAGKSAKKTIKQLDSGEDVSNIGSFSPIRQEEAADLSDIDFSYMTGANALTSQNGSADMNQLNRSHDEAVQNRRDQTGRQMVSALSDLRNSSTNTLMQARAQRNQNLLQQQQMLLQARGMQFNNQRSGGVLNSLIQGAAGVGAAFLGKPPG